VFCLEHSRLDHSGVNCGAGREWDFTRSALPRGQYEHSGARLRRAETVAEGIRLYKKEARKHGVSFTPQLFRHL